MKKTAYSRFLARAAVTLLVVFSFSGARAQEIVTIGEGTVTCNTNPIGTYYNYSITEQLYTAEEIGMAGTIESISFYYMGIAAKDLPITMYMKHVDAENLASAGITLADAEQVFSGTLSVTTTAGWVTITLDTPFEYDGESNLLIGFIKDYLYYFSGQSWQGTATSSTMARYTQNDSQAYDTSTVPGTAQANRPNIKIEITPSAGPVYKKPTDLIVSDLTSTGATISWTAPEGSPTGYAYQYKKASEEDWSNEATTTATSVALTGLTEGTNYNFRVKAVYGSDGESGFATINFRTEFGTFSLPYADSFENGIGGWTLVDCAGGTGITDAAKRTGSYCFRFYYNTNPPQYLISPQFDGAAPMTVSFWYRIASTDYPEKFQVGYSTTTNDVSAFTWEDEVTATNKDEWLQYVTEFPVGTKFVAIKYNSNDMYYLYLDDFEFEVADGFVKPTNLAASEIGSRSAKLSWTENGTATAWVLAYKTGDADFTEINTAENPYTLNGLTPETAYTVKVRQAGETNKWSDEITFTTAIAAPVPTNVVVSNVTKNSATVSWVSEATSFNVQYKATSAEEWQTTTATENSITITGLTPETEYQVQVQGNYGDLDGLSAWSAAVTFTTDVAFQAPTAVAANHVLATTAEISWTGNDDATSYNLRYGATTSVYCDFESVEAWSVDDFTPFTAYDGDGGSTYSIDGATFTNQGYTGSVITMENGGVPSNWTAHSGNKFGCFIDCTTPPNNDFFITPEVTITEGCTFSFWARSLTNQYGLERIKVGVYDGNGTFSSYLAGSADGYVEVPTNWTKYSYDLSAYIGQTIQLAINCVSNDAFALFIDDVSINMPPTEWNTPITDITTSSYQLEGLTPETTYVVQVQAVYEGGSSTWTSTNFTTIALDAVPFDLQTADVTATTATLNWEGTQDSYNVRYRKNPVYYFTTFNTNEDRAGWSYSSVIYGIDDTVYNIPGSSNFFLAIGWSTTAEEVICSPELPAYPSGSTLEFYHYYYSAENTFQFGYSTTTNDADAFTWSDPISSVSVNDAYTAKFSQVLPDGVKYIAFKATASDQSHCIFIDDFKIFDSSVSVDDWDETISNVDATTLTITGLDPETEYEWQVQGNLTEGTTAWSEVATFTTNSEMELVNDDSENEAGKKNSDFIAYAANKLFDVTLSGRTLYKDGEWNTICLPFDLVLEGSPLEGATAKTLTNAEVTDNGEYTHVELTFGDDVTTLQAGVPYIIKWEAGQENIVDPTFTGVLIKDVDEEVRTLSFADYQVQFIGYYDAFNITPEDVDIFYMTAGNVLKHTGQNRTLKSCRAYFQFSEEAQKARQFVLNFGDGNETTGIISTKNSPDSVNDGWYTVDGMKLGKQPKRKGVYIQNGRKVVIK